MSQLYNKENAELLEKKLSNEPYRRLTLSFYRYVEISNTQEFRDSLFESFSDLNILGRIYVAREGVNAQLSVPGFNYTKFLEVLNSLDALFEMRINLAIEDDGLSFSKLIIKVKKKIVADGLDDSRYDFSKVGKHLGAAEFNIALSNPETIVVDMRNHYESEVGHFERAICPPADTFKDELPFVLDQLKGKEDKPVLMYCTGGIRCEKASAYLINNGFENVSQLHGGIIEYARQVEQKNLESKFKGKNFVFDKRLGERISNEVISACSQCSKSSDIHRNCALVECNLLFIQCKECKEEHKGCCGSICEDLLNKSREERFAKLNEIPGTHAHALKRT